MPYPINFSPDLTRNTVLNEEANMIIVGIDNKVAGSAERDYDFGYIIETRDKDRRNSILNKTLSLIPRAQLGEKTTFGFVNASRSENPKINKDRVKLEFEKGTNELLGVTDLIIWKN